ncbi:MAG TPA: hypothetical protein VMG41_04325 [Gemmatimonadales bacterium]|nr:hypothetical protein [Gemmatimonadales bacterium]
MTPRTGPVPEWLRLDGRGWAALSPDAQQAYLAGFLAGGATAQALEAGAADSAGLYRALDSLSRAGFRFPYSPNVYGARVHDFYWYVDQRPQPLWYVLWEVNHRLHESPGVRQ